MFILKDVSFGLKIIEKEGFDWFFY